MKAHRDFTAAHFLRAILACACTVLPALGLGQADTGGLYSFGTLGLGQSASSVAPIRQVETGEGFTAALRSDGSVVCWGSNNAGQCSVPPTLLDAVQISASNSHVVALRSNGTVVCWGSNTNGESAPPSNLAGVVQVTAGGFFSAALKADGTVVAWGQAPYGVDTIHGAVKLTAGQQHLNALLSDGTSECVGDNTYYECGVPAGLVGLVGVDAWSYNSAGLRGDGTLLGWGGGNTTGFTSPLTGVIQLGGPCALLSDGTVKNWFPGAPSVPSGLVGVVQIAANGGAALKSDGSVVCWGDNSYGQCEIPAGLYNAVAVSSSTEHTAILTADHKLYCRGKNAFGECNVPVGLNDVVQVSTKGNFVGFLSDPSAHTIALRSGGTVLCWGDNRLGQNQVPSGLKNVIQVAAGGRHSVALKSDGTLVCWGDNGYGQCTLPPGIKKVKQIAAGGQFTMALQVDGTVACWGDNSNGQCNVPVGLSGITQISAGDQHALALDDKGMVSGWGSNTFSQLAFPSGLSGVVQIAAGGQSSAVRKSNGTVLSWGGFVSFDPNKVTHGQDKVPSGLQSALDVEAGFYVTNAISSVTISMTNWLVSAGSNTSATIFVPIPPGAGGGTVTLACSDPQVTIPATLHLNQGVQTGTIPVAVTGSAIAATVKITATYRGQSSNVLFRINPTTAPKAMIAPVTALAGRLTTCTVTLGAPLTAATPFTFGSDSPNATPARPTILVPKGAASFSFLVFTNSVAVASTAHVSVLQAGIKIATGQISLVPQVRVSLSLPSVVAGGTSVGTVSIPYPVESLAGVTLYLKSDSSFAKVPASVTIYSGNSITFNVTTSGVDAVSKATISATLDTLVPVSTQLTVEPAGAATVAVAPKVLIGDNQATLTVTLNGLAGPSGKNVSISASSVYGNLPAFVKVASGQSSVSATFAPKSVSSPVIVTVKAAAGGATAQNTFTIEPSPNKLVSISLDPPSTTPGPPVDLHLVFSGPSASTGLTVFLNSSSPAVSLPASITSNPGATSMDYLFGGRGVDVETPVTIQARGAGVTKTANLTLVPANLSYIKVFEPSGFNTSTYKVKGGLTVHLGAFANGFPGPSGIPLTLVSSDPGLVQVASPLTIPVGQPGVSFSVTTKPVTTQQTVTLTATHGSATSVVTLILTPTDPDPKVLEGINVSYQVTGGQDAYGAAYAYGVVPGGFTITLSSSDPTIAVVAPTTLTIGVSAGPSYFTVHTKAVKSKTTVTITAKQGTNVKTALLTINP